MVAVRRNWARFGDAVKEQVGEAVTVQCPEEIPFERIRQSRQTQEEKKANDLKTALQGSDKSQIVGRCVPPCSPRKRCPIRCAGRCWVILREEGIYNFITL